MKKFSIISLLAALFLFTGCASRKRDVQKVSSEYNFKSDIDTASHITLNTNIREQQQQASQYWYNNLNMQYQGEAGDSVSVDQYGPDGSFIGKTVFKGKGKLNLNNNQGSGTETKKEDKNTSTQSEKSSSGTAKITASGSKEKIVKHVETTGIGFWSWFWLIIILIAIIILIWLNYKFRWIAWIKNHVLKKISPGNNFGA